MMDTNKKLILFGFAFFLFAMIETPTFGNCIAYIIGLVCGEIIWRFMISIAQYENK